jgi:glucans biosynthesis protein
LQGAASVLGALGVPAVVLSCAESVAGQPRARTGQRAASGLRTVGAPQAFDYAWLKGHARWLASQPPRTLTTKLPESVASLDYDRYQAIQFRKDHALWANQGRAFRAGFFHLGLYFNTPVRMFEVVSGQASELAYDAAMFDYGKSGLRGDKLPGQLGFAGFRLNFHTDWNRDVAAFLGASYFRAVGGEWQYGLSARGLAIDTGMNRPEEFPVFTAFWLEQPAQASRSVTIHALLESPSVTGAYRFVLTPGDTLVMDIDAALYPRKPIERLGIAPCTSMYQCGENDRRMAHDFRPEIHDSDGLALWTGSGEWLWRPLMNPRALRFNAFVDENPRGFGLMQRDREFANYQDDGVFYDKRPCLWVEPRAGWGKGSVQLVEIPTVDETFDNIVAFWNPADKPQPGQELLFGYRLHWGARAPVAPKLAQVVATRTGLGGVVGQKRKYYSGRFAIDFAGGDLAMLDQDAKVEPVIRASRGSIEIPSARPLQPIRGYRAIFDLRPPDDTTDPIDVRVFLRMNGQALSETWTYQWEPPPPAERHLY